MSESQPITFSAENTPQGFSIEGDGKRFSLDEGEDLTDGKEGKEFGGFINLIGADGKTERFPGGIYDQGDHWQVLKFDGDGGEYLIPKAGGAPEVKQEAAEGVGPQPAEVSVGGLEDAAAVVAMDAVPVDQAAGVAPTEIFAEAVAELPVEPKEPVTVEEPVVEATQSPVSEPSAPEPEQIQVSASKSEGSTESSSMHPTIRNTVSRLQEIRREVAPQAEEAKRLLAVETEAKNLRRQAEKARGSINRLRNKDRISEKIAEEGALIRQAKELEDKVGVARSQDKYKEMDEHKTWRLEARRDATIALEADLGQWETVMRNPADFNFYRQVFEKWQQEGGNTGSLVSRVDQEFRPILDRFEQRLPRRLLELAGFVSPRPEGGQKGVDDDIWAVYNQATNQLYSELVGQPAAATELPAAPELVLPPEQVETVPEPLPVTETQPEVEVAPVLTEENQAEIIVPPIAVTEEASIAETEMAPEPKEASIAETEAAPEPEEVPTSEVGQGEVVISSEDQARAAAATPVEMPADVSAIDEHFFGQTSEEIEAEKARQRAELAAQTVPMPEATAETPEQRAERRKQGFAGAFAELDHARGDTSGTEREQIVRLAEAYNQAIGAAMEFMEEGDVAKNVVKGFLAGALGTSTGQKLTEVAVRSRMDEAGVTGAPVGEKKKKLEEAGLLGLLELLLELGMNFTDKTIGAVVTEVQSATGGGR